MARWFAAIALSIIMVPLMSQVPGEDPAAAPAEKAGKSILLPCATPATAPDWAMTASLGAMGRWGTAIPGGPMLSDRLTVAFEGGSPFFHVSAAVAADSDGRYPSHQSFELGHYFEMEEGLVEIQYRGIGISGGRMTLRDDLESPYSLFISSRSLPGLGARISWDTPVFEYSSSWMRLNASSDKYYEGTSQLVFDRGMNYKSYVAKFDALRVGFQDASVYLYKNFDAETFFSPIPAYVQQMALAASGRPYSEIANPNSLMGFFADWTNDAFSVQGQVLVDDINASFLSPVLGWAIPALRDVKNVQKFAWSLGGAVDTSIGRFGFHHGGASKYTFAATYTSTTNPDGFSPAEPGPDYSLLPYEYCRYPFTAYSFYGGTGVVDYLDNYIGFMHGENCLAFQVDWSREARFESSSPLSLSASFEYVVNGSKSPNNPWHEAETFAGIDKAFVLLDEAVLEHRLLFRFEARKEWRGWSFGSALELGYAWNRLTPLTIAGLEGEAKIWKPKGGDNAPMAKITLGAEYQFHAEGKGHADARSN